jgi:hypothetical protein
MGENASTPKNGTSKVVKSNGLGLPAISVNFEMLLQKPLATTGPMRLNRLMDMAENKDSNFRGEQEITDY